MKKHLHLFLISFFLLATGNLMANTVVIKGYVKDSTNHAIANRTVWIYNNDSTVQNCLIAHKVVTNPNGYFIDTLQCNGDIRKLMVVIENCNGNKIVQYPNLTTSGVIEVNFTICTPGTAPASCKAGFSSTPTNTGFKFNSSSSFAPAGDSIISRVWVFGDSSQPLTGNRVDPTHEYPKAGVYNVCLTIKTKNGCESKFCTTVTIHETLPAPTNCKAYFTTTIKDNVVYFSSKGSTVPDGDSIISRTWYYIDSATNTKYELGGNTIDTFISFTGTKPGKYTVYLVIKTKKGCESKYSGIAVIPPTTNGCTLTPMVSFEKINTYKFRFNSSKSVAQGDSIISRKWIFGDGTKMDGNEISPLKEYKDTGTYNVCVTMKTKSGCEKTFCLVAVVRDSLAQPATCKASATFSIYNNGLVKFNSAGSVGSAAGDSLISRTWIFGDNSPAVTNLVDPSHIYANAGSYTVYLYIKTQKGCESKYTLTVVIPTQPNACTLTAQVSFEKISTYKFRFISSQSTAQGDSIISRTWNFGDGTSLGGNEIKPTKEYKDTGKYIVTVVMKTKNGCEKTFSLTVLVRDTAPEPVPTNCKALFTFTIQNAGVKFNSAGSVGTSPDDSIISRTWIFGDSSAPVTGSVDPLHNYTRPGSYNVYLYIKTKKGCENKYAATVVIAPNPTNCPVDVQFVATRISLKKVQFNSEASHGLNGDSIIQRKWKFGDGTGLEGNTSNPVKEFPMIGSYNTCLEVKTAKGCIATVCKQVAVQDTVNVPTAPANHVKLVMLTPNPVVTRMLATIWSASNNNEVEITIYDIYGQAKMKLRKILIQGTNIIEIPAANLYRGPYYLTVSWKSGKDSKVFYKL
jgi:PKD repeat protein